MTLCIGIERKGRVWIGADCGSSDDEGWALRAKEPKVWVSNGWVIAGAGNWKALRAVRLAARFQAPPLTPSTADGMMLDIGRELETIFNRFEIKQKDEDGEATDHACNFLFGARGAGLWEFDIDFNASLVRGHTAIGAPDKYAMGWLDGSAISDPKTRISECIKAANKRMPTIMGPAKIIEAGLGEVNIIEEAIEETIE